MKEGFGIIFGAMTNPTTDTIVDLVMGLWQRSDRDFASKKARRSFFETCAKVLHGEVVDELEPDDDTPRDSAEWASYVAATDCKPIKGMLDRMTALADQCAALEQTLLYGADESDSDVNPGFTASCKRKRQMKPTDRRLKSNKTPTERENQLRQLDHARGKANEVKEATRIWRANQVASSSQATPETTYSDGESIQAEEIKADEVAPVTPASPEQTVAPTPSIDEEDYGESDTTYMERRERDSTPRKVPLPPLPSDYTKENEWIKVNIKDPDMLYSYVLGKAGNGIRWSSGLKKYYAKYSFWEFAFDTLSCGGWQDSEHNKPIVNVSKYITKVTIGEYERHEASKHSRFEGKFNNGHDLLEYIDGHCLGIKQDYKDEGFCGWFLDKMNGMGWRWGNGTPINNIPGEMSRHFPEYQTWLEKNAAKLVGVNPDQYETTAKLQRLRATGQWKPNAQGLYDLNDAFGPPKKKHVNRVIDFERI